MSTQDKFSPFGLLVVRQANIVQSQPTSLLLPKRGISCIEFIVLRTLIVLLVAEPKRDGARSSPTNSRDWDDQGFDINSQMRGDGSGDVLPWSASAGSMRMEVLP
jgi:hypothetical protein